MDVVAVEQKGPVSIIRIARPERLNAISSAVAVELQQAFQEFDRSPQRVAILGSVGERAFTAGADVNDSDLCCARHKPGSLTYPYPGSGASPFSNTR